MRRIFSKNGFTAIETVLAAAIMASVGLMIATVFTRANRMATNSRQAERAYALGQMVLEQYNACATRGSPPLGALDRTRVSPADFFGTGEDWGYNAFRISTRAKDLPEESATEVTIQIHWGGGLFASGWTFTQIYPRWLGEESEPERHAT